jgi:hypothetical protein
VAGFLTAAGASVVIRDRRTACRPFGKYTRLSNRECLPGRLRANTGDSLTAGRRCRDFLNDLDDRLRWRPRRPVSAGATSSMIFDRLRWRHFDGTQHILSALPRTGVDSARLFRSPGQLPSAPGPACSPFSVALRRPSPLRRVSRRLNLLLRSPPRAESGLPAARPAVASRLGNHLGAGFTVEPPSRCCERRRCPIFHRDQSRADHVPAPPRAGCRRPGSRNTTR